MNPTREPEHEAVFVEVENDAFHAVVDRISALAKRRPELRFLELAEFSPPHPWLRLFVPPDRVATTAEAIREALGCRVVTSAGLAESPDPDAAFREYDLPRYSDHRLRIGPAWPFRRFETFWSG